MRPDDGHLPDRRIARQRVDRVRAAVRSAPLPVKIVLVLAVLAAAVVASALPARVGDLVLLLALCYGPVAVWRKQRSVFASLGVAAWGLAAILFVAALTPAPPSTYWLFPLVLLPFAVVAAAHSPPLARNLVPCRTVAWTLLWAVPAAMLAWRFASGQPILSWVIGWLLAAVVLGWRLTRGLQESRVYGRQQARGVSGTGPYGETAARTTPGASPAGAGRASHPAGAVRAVQDADGTRVQQVAAGVRERPAPDRDLPTITVEQAVAELDAMIGLAGVKDQIHQLTASVEAARRRAQAGYQTEKPMQHFVFLGPPGTGKTSVARIIAKIYYAFGLLESPSVLEAQRADLVGEFLGATAIKTNELVDAALGGVLFIDEAYSLANDGEGHSDRFGNEAVQALLKRAEDERDRLIVILAGYDRQMEDFLASNPGLNSRFAIRIKFAGYSPAELLALAQASLAQRGESLSPDAGPALARMMEDIGRRRLGDELGNGRFVRSLLEKAGQVRDVRVMADGAEPAPSDLLTLEAADLQRAFAELTSRFRGYAEAPTVESALAELDELIGLEPVKRQVHEIAAQLRVARLRDRQGLVSQPPARHFVFTGPPGTGKTTVARILGRIFAALGLLVRPEVVEAHRADLVGEHLGSTAIKTGKLIDSALGGVLFIDEAYALYNPGYAGGDAYGAEAVATLLKRAEDDRDRLVIVLAGYTADMDRFLRSNPGLSSRFSVRIGFPSYTPGQLAKIAEVIAEQAGDSFDPDALPVLERIFQRACDSGRIDELGNGRFARSLFERACAARDLRVADLGDQASAADLTIVTAADLTTAVSELTREPDRPGPQ
ncbi:MAG TPA: AAA family ATPase [Streptosporangiaceae bacterium]|nr:AAA family ATPase [Streptosporangiaceae bacterium]